MDLKKAKLLLDKINALYKNISADKKNVSSIERDLMRNYILQFYESFLDVPGPMASDVPSVVEIIKSTPKPVESRKVEKAPTPKPAPAPKPKVVSAPAPEPKPEVPAPPPVAEKKAPPPPPPAPKPAAPLKTNEDLEELFSFNDAKELSEKLSEMPITNIKKAMGLNERIFTVNELFGGDQAVFDLTLDTLNKLPDFNQAKSFLVRNAATKFNWTAKTRKGKAKNFIKLVKRRYS